MALALITGASGGIGSEFSKILAQKKYDIILVSSPRSQDILSDMKNQLQNEYGVKVYAFSYDLSDNQQINKMIEDIQSQNLKVDFLINNAGLLYNGYFHQLDINKQLTMINVNINALTSLSHWFANDMASRAGGYILNVASTAAWQAVPKENVYAASKAYVLAFSHALTDEMDSSKTGVKVSVLCPHYTATKMLDNPDQGEKLNFFIGGVLSPELVARKGIEGCLAGKPTIIPGFMNVVTTYVYQLFPKMLLTRMVGKIYRMSMK